MKKSQNNYFVLGLSGQTYKRFPTLLQGTSLFGKVGATDYDQTLRDISSQHVIKVPKRDDVIHTFTPDGQTALNGVKSDTIIKEILIQNNYDDWQNTVSMIKSMALVAAGAQVLSSLGNEKHDLFLKLKPKLKDLSLPTHFVDPVQALGIIRTNYGKIMMHGSEAFALRLILHGLRQYLRSNVDLAQQLEHEFTTPVIQRIVNLERGNAYVPTKPNNIQEIVYEHYITKANKPMIDFYLKTLSVTSGVNPAISQSRGRIFDFEAQSQEARNLGGPNARIISGYDNLITTCNGIIWQGLHINAIRAFQVGLFDPGQRDPNSAGIVGICGVQHVRTALHVLQNSPAVRVIDLSMTQLTSIIDRVYQHYRTSVVPDTEPYVRYENFQFTNTGSLSQLIGLPEIYGSHYQQLVFVQAGQVNPVPVDIEITDQFDSTIDHSHYNMAIGVMNLIRGRFIHLDTAFNFDVQFMHREFNIFV